MVGLVILSPAGSPARGDARAPSLTARARPRRLSFGGTTAVSGALSGEPGRPAGILLRLLADAYPYKSFRPVATTRTRADGSYSFRIQPGRNTLYEVQAGDARSGRVPVIVDEVVHSGVRVLRGGRVRLSVRSRHPRSLRWDDRKVVWYLGRGPRRDLRRVQVTRSRGLGPSLMLMQATVKVPRPGRFRWAACLDVASRQALGPPGTHPRCDFHRFSGGDGALYQGTGRAPFGYPPRRSIEAARRYLARRRDAAAFAVVGSQGRIYGSRLHRRFPTASVVKAMLLVAYLDMRASEHRRLTERDRSILDPMIRVSDNNAATAAWSRVGDGRLRALARRARMTDFSISGFWLTARTSAADQANYFLEMNHLIALRFRGYADHLLSHITGSQSWGIPAAARPRGWSVRFKGGWYPFPNGYLVNQAARIRRGNTRIGIAVMTNHNPSMPYGERTIAGATRSLLRSRP